MKVTTTQAHPQGRGRGVKKTYALRGVGASGSLPDDLNEVSIMAVAGDGVDQSTSSRVFITLGLDDDPAQLDSLIRLLSDLRTRQRANLPAATGQAPPAVQPPHVHLLQRKGLLPMKTLPEVLQDVVTLFEEGRESVVIARGDHEPLDARSQAWQMRLCPFLRTGKCEARGWLGAQWSSWRAHRGWLGGAGFDSDDVLATDWRIL